MTNKKGQTETVVISATDGAAGELHTDAAAPPVTPAQPVPAQGAATAGQTEMTSPDNVEYEPVVYSDPGAVTEQFDHLATRDPEAMQRAPEGPGAAVATGAADLPTELERETVAMSSANELGYQNPEASSDHAADTVQELRGTGEVKDLGGSGDVAREVGEMVQGKNEF